MAASAIFLVDAAYDSRLALKRSRRDPYAFALLNGKIQGMDNAELDGHRMCVCPDTEALLLTAFVAAIRQVLSKRVEFGCLISRRS
jgi:hypothetical protein